MPVIVTHGGQFVRGLKQQDFEIFEDGVKQPIASLASEDAPLDLVLAIDVSGSMEHALDAGEGRRSSSCCRSCGPAMRRRSSGSTTRCSSPPSARRISRRASDAVDLLTSWGGTALYDATVRALDLVSRDWGRKGIVIFSDGDDRNSLTPRETAMARVQASDAMLYTDRLRRRRDRARAAKPSSRTTRRRPAAARSFPQRTQELDGVFEQIVAELANQYVLSYASTNLEAGQHLAQHQGPGARAASTTSGRGTDTGHAGRSDAGR